MLLDVFHLWTRHLLFHQIVTDSLFFLVMPIDKNDHGIWMGETSSKSDSTDCKHAVPITVIEETDTDREHDSEDLLDFTTSQTSLQESNSMPERMPRVVQTLRILSYLDGLKTLMNLLYV